MSINMHYCRVRNVLSAVRELNEQLKESQGLSEDEYESAADLMEETEDLLYLLQDTYNEE